jgi:hypothetical protein
MVCKVQHHIDSKLCISVIHIHERCAHSNVIVTISDEQSLILALDVIRRDFCYEGWYLTIVVHSKVLDLCA